MRNLEEFSSGAVRDSSLGKSRIDLISPLAEKRLGDWLCKGAEKYGDRNWEKGMPMSRIMASLKRHLNAYCAGQRDEDHLAAVMCNAMFLAHGEAMIAGGGWKEEFCDMPQYVLNDAMCKSTNVTDDENVTKVDLSCFSCAHNGMGHIRCCDCKDYSKWEPK